MLCHPIKYHCYAKDKYNSMNFINSSEIFLICGGASYMTDSNKALRGIRLTGRTNRHPLIDVSSYVI
jgi:hypothetical protein